MRLTEQGVGGISKKCDELLNGRRFVPKLKGAVYKSNRSPVIMYGDEVWCLKARFHKERRDPWWNNVWSTVQRLD